MAIHTKAEILPDLKDQVSGNIFLPHPLPKYKFPKQETNPSAAYQLVHDELLLDGNSRQNVATFCQTLRKENQRTAVWNSEAEEALLQVAPKPI
jgi:glutamate decarboxylase